MKVSVIIPHYNQIEHLTKCLTALNMQTAVRSSYEIIVIDNGTKNNLESVISELCNQLIFYTTTKNPYTCRNIGIKSSKAPILAFLDSKCVPKPNYITTINTAFESSLTLDVLVGGFDLNASSQEMYAKFYSLHHLNQSWLVSTQSGFLTGNFACQKKIFDDLGGFPDNSISGGDIIWSQRVFENSFTVVYNPALTVKFRAKEKSRILSDTTRDGQGAYFQFKNLGKPWYFHTKMIFYHLLPDRPIRILNKIKHTDTPGVYSKHILSLWWIIWRTNLYFCLGYVLGIFKQR